MSTGVGRFGEHAMCKGQRAERNNKTNRGNKETKQARMGKKKTIGIKYCGGCNPTYERVEMVQQVQSLLKDRFIFSIDDQQDSDIMVFVCGCPRACANKNSKYPEDSSRLIIGENDFKSLIDWLEGLVEKGDF
jgi:hypothetical protein